MIFTQEGISLSKENGDELCFAFFEDKLLVKVVAGDLKIPMVRDLALAGIKPYREQYVGKFGGYQCYSAELINGAPPAGMDFQGLRQLLGLVEEELFWVAGRAFQIMDWDRTHLYCGHCGAPTETETTKYAKVCPKCGFVSYPRISPAIIVAVIKEKQILLARNKHRPHKFYSVLAGFVEPGESLEECVRREVREEVGIEVKNIKYFGSQPWPFPNSLMVAFTAEYEDGEIRVDEEEITEAGWFTAAELPPVPGRISIARHLIDWFSENCG